MENAEQATGPKWAIVELMGHVRTGGLISKDTEFATPMLRLDVPKPDRAGFVTQYINPASIYRVTITDEPLARAAAANNNAAPLHPWEIRDLEPVPTTNSDTYLEPPDGGPDCPHGNRPGDCGACTLDL